MGPVSGTFRASHRAPSSRSGHLTPNVGKGALSIMTPRPNPQLNRLRDSLQKSRTQFQVIPFQVIPFPCAECAVATTGRAVALRTCVVEALAEPTATPVSAAATVPTLLPAAARSGTCRDGICQPVWGTDLHLLLSGGLLRLGLVDPRRSRRAGRGGRLVDEPFGVGGVRRVKDAGPFGVDGLGAPVVHVGRDVQPQTGVPVLVVVPAEEGLTVHASRFDRGEAGGEVGPVLQRLELGLGVWVVIAHVRSGVGLGDPE